MDITKVRTAAELEQKYNLSKLAKNIANIEVLNGQIVKTQNELNDIKKTLIINLGDTLQSSVSLWFYEGTPTTSNEPYIDWTTPSDHIDDLYYDQNSGYVYKYTSNGWIRQINYDLVSALALTNAELDTSIDHERQVFLTKPTPPYQSGDWWIQEDGTLLICQLGKLTGEYEENDFVNSSMYTTTIATKQGDMIEVLKGRVIQIIDETFTKTEIQKIVEGVGVDGVKVTSVTSISGTFDENGMHYEKTGSKTKSTINEIGVDVKKTIDNAVVLFAGFNETLGQSVVEAENFRTRKYLNIANNSRIEDYEDGGGVFIL